MYLVAVFTGVQKVHSKLGRSVVDIYHFKRADHSPRIIQGPRGIMQGKGTVQGGLCPCAFGGVDMPLSFYMGRGDGFSTPAL